MLYQALNLLRINERDDLRIKKMFTGRPTVTGKLVVYYISSKFLKGADLGQLWTDLSDNGLLLSLF